MPRFKIVYRAPSQVVERDEVVEAKSEAAAREAVESANRINVEILGVRNLEDEQRVKAAAAASSGGGTT
jgi:hypothetical protein